MTSRIDARQLLQSYIGRTIETFVGRPNSIIGIENDFVFVGTARSPAGTRVPIVWIQSGIDRLVDEGQVEINVTSLGYRSAFVGAVLLSLPGVTESAHPARALVHDRSMLERLFNS